mgnify:FL=1|jgi:hemerythrin-like metal-binding domain
MPLSARFPWKPEYTVGNEFIDAQHQTLLELANLLHVAINAGQGYRVIQSAFAALMKYTEEHFADEERFWENARSQRLNQHRREHREITEELAALRHEGEFGVVFCTPNELANWIEHRLIAHVINDDQDSYRALAKPPVRGKR